MIWLVNIIDLKGKTHTIFQANNESEVVVFLHNYINKNKGKIKGQIKIEKVAL